MYSKIMCSRWICVKFHKKFYDYHKYKRLDYEMNTKRTDLF